MPTAVVAHPRALFLFAPPGSGRRYAVVEWVAESKTRVAVVVTNACPTRAERWRTASEAFGVPFLESAAAIPHGVVLARECKDVRREDFARCSTLVVLDAADPHAMDVQSLRRLPPRWGVGVLAGRVLRQPDVLARRLFRKLERSSFGSRRARAVALRGVTLAGEAPSATGMAAWRVAPLEEPGPPFECPICLSERPSDAQVILHDAHRVCSDCYVKLLTTARYQVAAVRCPLCRKDNSPTPELGRRVIPPAELCSRGGETTARALIARAWDAVDRAGFAHVLCDGPKIAQTARSLLENRLGERFAAHDASVWAENEGVTPFETRRGALVVVPPFREDVLTFAVSRFREDGVGRPAVICGTR